MTNKTTSVFGVYSNVSQSEKAVDALVAAGVSCRHQIADFTSARAMHPAELLGTLVQETA